MGTTACARFPSDSTSTSQSFQPPFLHPLILATQMSSSSFFTILPVGMLQTNCYIFGDAGQVVVIDPGFPEVKITSLIRELAGQDEFTLHILLTHGHADHFMGVNFLLRQFPGSPLYISEGDKPYLFDSKLNCARMFNIDLTLENDSTLKIVKDGDVLQFGKYKVNVVATPGHTPGGVCYIIHDEKTVFAGDTMFCGGRGRTDLPGGNDRQLTESIRTKLLTLPDDYRVYPGHGRSTSIKYEKH